MTTSRRIFLRGMGVSLALPWLELTHAQAAAPIRLLTWFWTNGTRDSKWFPANVGNIGSDDLAPAMAALKGAAGKPDIAAQLNIVGGVTDLNKLWTVGHSCAMFAAGDTNRDTHGDYGEWPSGSSIDQICAAKLGTGTRFPSLVISGGGANMQTGRAIVSWNNGTPVTPESEPKALFRKLFGDSSPGAATELARIAARRRSVMDAAREDGQRLSARLGAADKRKVDEHLTALRALEKELSPPSSMSSCTGPDKGPFDAAKLSGGLFASDREPLLQRLLVFAFRCDLSRYGSFMLDCASGQKSYPLLGSPGHDHDLSHNAPDDIIVGRTNVKLDYLATLLRDLQNIDEGGRSLLSNSIIYSNSEIFDGAKHSREHLPIIIAGQAGGKLKSGRFVQYGAKAKPLSDLLSSLLNYAGVPTDKFGSAGTGPLTGF